MTFRIRLTIVCSLLVAFGGCAAPRVPESPDALEPLWQPLMKACPCPTPQFKGVLHKVVEQWGLTRDCQIALEECYDLEVVNKEELKAQIFVLEEKVSTGWQKILLWAGVSLVVGFALGMAVN